MYPVPKEIPSDLLVLRRFEAEDLDPFTRFMTDHEATRFLAFDSDMKTAIGAEALLRTTIEAYDSNEPMFALAAAEKDSRSFVGMCGLSPLEGDEVEIFYAVVRGRWGRGFASEIALCLSRFAFVELKVCRLAAFIVPGNVASERVAEKTGFRRDGLVEHPGFAQKVYRYTLGEGDGREMAARVRGRSTHPETGG